MRDHKLVAKSHTAKTAEAGPSAGWQALLQMALRVHDLDDGLELDLPAGKYELILNLVEHERENCDSSVHFSLRRREGLILLTATSDLPDGGSKICSMMGVAPRGT